MQTLADAVTLPFVLEVLSLLLHGGAVASILLFERRRPTATLAWILAVALLPFVGILLYLTIGATKARRISARSRPVAEAIARELDRRAPPGSWVAPATDEARTQKLIALGARTGGSHACGGNRVTPLVNGPAAYRSMIQAIEAAEKHVHILFYIIQPDRTGAALRDRLVEKARRGVKVRVLYDDVGSHRMMDGFFAPLEDAGGEVASFNPVSRVRRRLGSRDRIDFRNHRKVVVVDGHVGFTGGINVGREYLGLDPEIGDWRDTHLRIEGPSVLPMQLVFARDWAVACGEVPDLEGWFPSLAASGDTIVQIAWSGPDSGWFPIERLHVQALAEARERAWLATPYLVPGEVVQDALVNAALRGVDVRILVPARHDHLVIALASRTYYPDLMDAGVRIWEYGRGFMHAKTMIVDSWMATVGSSNLDIRSFRLNFELNAFVYDAAFCRELSEQFRVDLSQAREITAAELAALPAHRRLARNAARLLSPLL